MHYEGGIAPAQEPAGHRDHGRHEGDQDRPVIAGDGPFQRCRLIAVQGGRPETDQLPAHEVEPVVGMGAEPAEREIAGEGVAAEFATGGA